MAGIDNIKNEILQEAQTKAEGLKAEARKKAEAEAERVRRAANLYQNNQFQGMQ